MNSIIETKSRINNTDGFRKVPKTDPIERDFTLIIDRLGDLGGETSYRVYLGGKLFRLHGDIKARITDSKNRLQDAIQSCREEWMKAVIDLSEVVTTDEGETNRRFFQDAWDHHDKSDEWLAKIGVKLAAAGHSLWHTLFYKLGDAGAKQIGDLLAEAANQRRLIGSITSDDVFVPWNLLYTRPKEKPFHWSGFWGYQHVVEHRTQSGVVDWQIDASTGELCASFNMDKTLDEKLKVECIAPQEKFFDGLKASRKIVVQTRTMKAEIAKAFTTTPFPERIAYFCCHGKVSGSHSSPYLGPPVLRLSDPKDAITRNDIENWLEDRTLDPHPFIFFNVCESAQMQNIFYGSVAALLLEKLACALLGSQIDVPAVFAPEYTRRFFERFIPAVGEVRPRLGWIVRDLAQELVRDHKNPLGITYSLYRGIDCVIRRGASDAEPAETA